MWLSKKAAARGFGAVEMSGCQDGVVTISSGDTAVMSGCEQRRLDVCAPGGYSWRPEVGQDVIIIKTAEGSGVVAGTRGAGSDELSPGEVMLSSGGCSILLKNSGVIELSGDVYINGKRIEV